MVWKNLSGKKIDNVLEKLKALSDSGEFSIHVGSDSQTYSAHTNLITTICFREPQKGVIVFYRSQKVLVPPSLRDRLLMETIDSLEIANMIYEMTGKPPSVHLDINPNEKYKSNKFYDELTGMVNGCGFECITKPNAFAAAIADMFTR